MFEGHPKPRNTNEPATEDELHIIDELEKTSIGTAAETVMKKFTAGLRTGEYQLKPRAEDPESAAVTSAMGMLARTATEISRNKPMNAQQVMLVFDPADGPGAAQPMKVLDVELTGVPKEFTACSLFGLATNFGMKLPYGLRVVVIVPTKMTTMLDGQVRGHVTALYCYRPLDSNQTKLGALRLKMEKTDGHWVTTNESEIIIPDEYDTWPQVLRAMFVINQAILPVHNKFRLKEKKEA